jgi:hypothetical protein
MLPNWYLGIFLPVAEEQEGPSGAGRFRVAAAMRVSCAKGGDFETGEREMGEGSGTCQECEVD